MTTVARAPIPGLIDWPRSEAAHRGLPWEIWWVTATVTAGGRRLALHLLIVHLQNGAVSVAINLTDLDAGTELAASHRLHPPGEARLSTEALSIETPSMGDGEVGYAGSFEDGYRLRADLGDGCGVDLMLTPTMPVLLNGGGGEYLIKGGRTTQYSLGALDVAGMVRIAGETATATGQGWYDRQWEEVARDAPLSFTWFGLCLDEGDVLSVFDARGTGADGHQWATIVQRDGTHLVVAVDAAAADVGRSGLGRPVPRRWTVTVPALDGVLEIEQQAIADGQLIHTGVLTVAGSYRGGPASGYGFCDIVGPVAR